MMTITLHKVNFIKQMKGKNKMLRKYNKKMFLDYASAFDYYDEMKETMQSWSLKQFHDFYDFTHYDWESGRQLKPNRKETNEQ